MNKWLAVTGLLVVLVGAAAVSGLAGSSAQNEPISNSDDAAVRAFVVEFGTKLQMVSLLAPAEERKAQMDAAYGAYVAPELLAAWYPDGAEALGRQTSSPWPESIEVVEVAKTNESTYRVEANIIEVASGQNGQQEPAAVQPITLSVEKTPAGYRIVGMSKGSYSELPKRQQIVGYWECLPHKDTTGPQTMECAFGIEVDNSDGHYAIDTSLMSTYPVDYPTGTKVRVSGIVTPAEQLSATQRYDIDGVIRATSIEKL